MWAAAPVFDGLWALMHRLKLSRSYVSVTYPLVNVIVQERLPGMLAIILLRFGVVGDGWTLK
jgi:hypothetical protein